MAESVVTRPLVERRAQIVYPGEPGHDPGNSAAPAPADTVVEPAFVLKLLKNLYPVVGYGVDASGAEVDITTFAPDDEALERLWELSALPGAAALMVAHDAVPLLLRPLPEPERCDRRALELAVGTLANLAAHGVAEGFNANGVAAALAAHGPDALYALLLGTAHAEVLSELMRLMAAAVALRFPDCYSVPEAWQLPLGSPEVAARLVHVFANSLHSELLERTAALVLAAYPLGRIPYSLHEAGALAALCGTLPERWRAAADEDGGSRALAPLVQVAEKCADLAVGVDEEASSKEYAKRVAAMGDDDGDTDDEAPPMPLTIRVLAGHGVGADHPVWRALAQIATRAAHAPTACAACGFLARACEADDGAALAAQVCLDASIVGGLVRLLRRLEAEVDAAAPAEVSQLGTHTGWDAPDESVVRCDGVRAAWALLHAGARLIDGLEVGLHPDGAAAAALGVLVAKAAPLLASARWARAHADVGVGPHRVQVDAEPVATATLQRLLEAAGVVLTSREAPPRPTATSGGGADELLEALGAWQRFFDGDDEEEEEGGGGAAEGGGGGWEDSDDDGVPWADDG